MPSFDIVSKVDMHEISNAVDQANREVSTRFDFKDADARFELSEDKIILVAQTDFQLKQMKDILNTKLAKRQVDLLAFNYKDPQMGHKEARQIVEVREGIDTEKAKKIVKLIKDKKLKVQASIQGDQVRVTGKKKDDLQDVIETLRREKLELPLQFENFRD